MGLKRIAFLTLVILPAILTLILPSNAEGNGRKGSSSVGTTAAPSSDAGTSTPNYQTSEPGSTSGSGTAAGTGTSNPAPNTTGGAPSSNTGGTSNSGAGGTGRN